MRGSKLGMSRVLVYVYNAKLLNEVTGGDGETTQRVEHILKKFPGAEVSYLDGDLAWKAPDGIQESFGCANGEVKVILNLAFPFYGSDKFSEIADIFEKVEPAYLATHTTNGHAVPSLIVTNSFGDFVKAKHDCFPFMISDKEGRKLTDGDNRTSYDDVLNMDHVFYSSDKQLDEAIKYKDNLGDHYGKDVSDDAVLARSARDVPERIDKLLSIETGNRALDVGCSCGLITAKLAETGKRITGVEIVPNLYEEAVKMRESLSEKVKASIDFINAPIEKCNFERESFDVIYMTEIFEHIPESIHKSLIKQVISYLKPDGAVVFSVPNRYPAKKYVDEERHRWDWFNHVAHFTEKSVAYFLGQYFRELSFHTVYDEPVNEGIFLICKAKGKK